MKCPKCGSAEFKPFKTEGVEIDFCSGCKGIWFEKGELAFYVETSEDLPSLRTSLPESKESKYACPACLNVKLLEMPYSQGDNLLLDYCSSCNGIWLDAKEIAKVEGMAPTIKPLVKISNTIKTLNKMGYKITGMKFSR